MTRRNRLAARIASAATTIAVVTCLTAGGLTTASAAPFTLPFTGSSGGGTTPGPSTPPLAEADHVFEIIWDFRSDPQKAVTYAVDIKKFSSNCVDNVSPVAVQFKVSVPAGAATETRRELFGYDKHCLPFLSKYARWQIKTNRDIGRGDLLVDDTFVDFTGGEDLTWDQETYEDKDPVVLDRIATGLRMTVYPRNPR